MMFPIGTKLKKFNDKINIISHLHISDFDKEISNFYNRIPLKKEPFEIITEKVYISKELLPNSFVTKKGSKKKLSKIEIENIKKIQSKESNSHSKNKSKKIIKL